VLFTGTGQQAHFEGSLRTVQRTGCHPDDPPRCAPASRFSRIDVSLDEVSWNAENIDQIEGPRFHVKHEELYTTTPPWPGSREQ
jgi:hypothetical protein